MGVTAFSVGVGPESQTQLTGLTQRTYRVAVMVLTVVAEEMLETAQQVEAFTSIVVTDSQSQRMTTSV